MGVKRLVAGMMLALLTLIGVAMPASAAAYTKGVYEPKLSNGETIEGWADVNINCDGTLGCWTYVKMEFKPDDSITLPPWLNKWQFVDGRWAKDGWNKIETGAFKKGCGQYRMVVDTYNDMTGAPVATLNIKDAVTVPLGDGLKRYQITSTSKAVRLCAMA